MDTHTDRDTKQEDSKNNKPHFFSDFFTKKFTKKDWIIDVIVFLILFIINDILDLNFIAVVFLTISFICFQFVSLTRYKIIKYLMVLIALFFFGLASFNFYSSITQQNIEELKTEFSSQLNFPVNSVMIFIVFHNPIELNQDYIKNLNLGFEILSPNGHLQISANLITPPLTPIQSNKVTWLTVNKSTPDSNDFHSNQYNVNKKIKFDTLYIPIDLLFMYSLPFKTLDDFHSMYFLPYPENGLIPFIKECVLVVNDWIIVKGNFSEVKYWQPNEINWDVFGRKIMLSKPWDSNFQSAKPPKALWLIDFTKLKPEKF